MTIAQFSRDDIFLYQGREEGREEGEVKGRIEDILELLEDIGEPSEMLRDYIIEQNDLEVLRRWLKMAAKANSIKDFEQAVVNINDIGQLLKNYQEKSGFERRCTLCCWHYNLNQK